MQHTKRDPNRIPVMSYIPSELAAKMRTEIEGKRVNIKAGYGKVADTTREMGMSDFVVLACAKATRKTVASKKATQWVMDKINANTRKREGKR